MDTRNQCFSPTPESRVCSVPSDNTNSHTSVNLRTSIPIIPLHSPMPSPLPLRVPILLHASPPYVSSDNLPRQSIVTGNFPCVGDAPSTRHSSAADAAVAAERIRTRELESHEASLGAESLRAVLKIERRRSSRLTGDLVALRSAAVESQAQAEAHEEGRINFLLGRLDKVQKEKGRIIVELEREEEMLTNSLQKSLTRFVVRRHNWKSRSSRNTLPTQP